MDCPWTELEGEFPKETSYSNELEYFEYRRSLAIMESEDDEYEKYHPNEPWDAGRNIMYHPNFAQAFAVQIAGQHEGEYILSLHEISHYLEKRFCQLGDLMRPDCDYLADSLLEYSSASNPKVERALRWLEAKKTTLPAWPLKFTNDLNGKSHRISSNEKSPNCHLNANESALPHPWKWKGTKGQLVLVAKMLIDSGLIEISTTNKTTFYKQLGFLLNSDLGSNPINNLGTIRHKKSEKESVLDKLTKAFKEIIPD